MDKEEAKKKVKAIFPDAWQCNLIGQGAAVVRFTDDGIKPLGIGKSDHDYVGAWIDAATKLGE